MTSPKRRRHAPIHEAGHAIIARILGIPCGIVTIIPDGKGTVGKFEFAMPNVCRRLWAREGYVRPHWYANDAVVIALLAGVIAEQEILGDICGGDAGDRKIIAGLVAGEDYLERLARATRMLVRRHRGRIEYLSKWLWREGTLTDDQINSWLFLPSKVRGAN
jgi:hypothetical protein